MWGRRVRVNLVDTAEMDAFFERLDHLSEEQLMSMRAAWRTTSRREHEDAWTAVRVAAARDGLTNELDRVRKKALRWATRGHNSIPYGVNDDLDWQQVKMEAGEAIVDAALAVALGSRLSESTRGVLIGPWLGVVRLVE